MIEIECFKPSGFKIEDDRLTLVFAYKCLSIKKDGDVFEFIPMYGRRIIIDLTSRMIDNTETLFIFQRGNQFLKFHLYQLLLVSDMKKYLLQIIEEIIEVNTKSKKKEKRVSRKVCKEAKELIRKLEEDNIYRLIEKALFDNDKALFEQLMKLKKKKFGGQSNEGA